MAENHEKTVIRESPATVVRSLGSDAPSDGGDEEAPTMAARASGGAAREDEGRKPFFLHFGRIGLFKK